MRKVGECFQRHNTGDNFKTTLQTLVFLSCVYKYLPPSPFICHPFSLGAGGSGMPGWCSRSSVNSQSFSQLIIAVGTFLALWSLLFELKSLQQRFNKQANWQANASWFDSRWRLKLKHLVQKSAKSNTQSYLL